MNIEKFTPSYTISFLMIVNNYNLNKKTPIIKFLQNNILGDARNS